MPYKLGNEKTVDFENDGQGLIANVQNKGSVHSNPIIEIDIKKPQCIPIRLLKLILKSHILF